MQSPTTMVSSDEALVGRDLPLVVESDHLFYGGSATQPPASLALVSVGMGCFWGAEKSFWSLRGVHWTCAGYQGGVTKNPTYQEVCSGLTGHAEVVRVAYSPEEITLEQILQHFFEQHDPTQGFRQGADTGTQYRSAIYVRSADEVATATAVRDTYEQRLQSAGFGAITTEIAVNDTFYWAEDYHQQYLIANPGGYCGIGGTGVSCPIGLGA